MIVPREVTLEELTGIVDTLEMEISVLEIRDSFVVYGKKTSSRSGAILSELVSEKPSREVRHSRIFTGISLSTDFLNKLLSSMNSSLTIYGEETN